MIKQGRGRVAAPAPAHAKYMLHEPLEAHWFNFFLGVS